MNKKAGTLAIGIVITMTFFNGCGNRSAKETMETTMKEQVISSIEESTTQKENMREELEGMKEFQPKDGSFSIYLPKSWEIYDAGVNDFLMAGDPKGETASIIMRMSKMDAHYKTMEEFQNFISTKYKIQSEISESEVPDAKNLSNGCAESGRITIKEQNLPVYVAYLEGERDFYCMLFMGEEDSYQVNVDTFRKICSTLVPLEVDFSSDFTVSPTLRWINATYAPLMLQNGANRNLLGGYELTEIWTAAQKNLLEQSWGITDRTGLDETIAYLEAGDMHHSEAQKLYEEMKLGEFSDRNALLLWCQENGRTKEDMNSILAIYDAVNQYGDHSILAWDLVRGISLAGSGYVAGYYSYDEAMELSKKLARKLQETYTSWDDMMESYFLGYQYWAGEDPQDPSSIVFYRKQLYEQLKSELDSPYLLDWNLNFE